VSKDWLFYHILDVLRSEAYRRPERDIYCSQALAARLGIAATVLAVVLCEVMG